MDPSPDISRGRTRPIGAHNDALCGHQGSRIHARDSAFGADGLSNLIDLTMTDLGHGLEGTRRLRLLRAPTGIALSQGLDQRTGGPGTVSSTRFRGSIGRPARMVNTRPAAGRAESMSAR